MSDAVVAPGPDSTESKLLHAVWRAGSFIQRIAAEDDAQVLKKPFKGRRIKGQAGKFNAIAIHVQDNGLVSRDNQPAKDSKFWSFPSKKLNDAVGIVQGTRIDNHCRYFSESDLRTESKFEFSPADSDEYSSR
jgi:hypothetical protein